MVEQLVLEAVFIENVVIIGSNLTCYTISATGTGTTSVIGAIFSHSA